MVKLGDLVQDEISGFKGIADGITEWLNGCRRIGIIPQQLNKDGNPVERQWFDEDQVKVIEVASYIPKGKIAVPAKKPGGPRNDPSNRRE